MKSLRSILTALLIFSFGVPSIGGSGLHLFLAHPCACHESDHVSCHESKSVSDHDVQSAAGPGLTEFQPPHDETTCFLCQFLSTPADLPLEGAALSAEIPAGRPTLPNLTVWSDDVSSLHSGRSPPALS